MIYRQNWLDTREYIHYLDAICGRDPETVSRYRAHLRHLLEWADSTPLPNAKAVPSTFPAYLLTARADGKQTSLSPSSIKRALTTAQAFYKFAMMEWSGRYRTITERWVDHLRPLSQSRFTAPIKEHEYFDADSILKIATTPTNSLHEQRAKVAACMLFASGMRADALASLPLQCVDLPNRRITQDPYQGVRTKNSKAGITYLLPIQPLLDVISEWDVLVRKQSPQSLWYANLTTDGTQLTATDRAYIGRAKTIREDVAVICQLAGVEYLSPHKLRHGHVVWSLQRAQNMQELKAISQNVMHASVTITDQIYGGLLSNEVQATIANLGHSPHPSSLDEKISQILQLLQKS